MLVNVAASSNTLKQSRERNSGNVQFVPFVICVITTLEVEVKAMTIEQFLEDYRKFKKFVKYALAGLFLYCLYQFAYQRGRIGGLTDFFQQMQAAAANPSKPDGEPGNLQHPIPDIQ